MMLSLHKNLHVKNNFPSDELPEMPCFFVGNMEVPLQYSFSFASLRLELEHVESSGAKLLIKPTLFIDKNIVNLDDISLLECAEPGIIYNNIYYRFPPQIKRMHLRDLKAIRNITIPEPLFGTFIESALPEMNRFVTIAHQDVVEDFVTLPFTGEIKGRCSLSYLDGELEASLFFSYDGIEVCTFANNASYNSVDAFVTKNGILERNLVKERKILEDIFSDFIFNKEQGSYIAKTERKIVEFMTEVIPRYQSIIKFECPKNLLDQFLYDNTEFSLFMDYGQKIGYYSMTLTVKGELKGIKLDLLWECMSSKRSFIELNDIQRTKQGKVSSKFSKILVLDIDKIAKIIQFFDEIGVNKLDNYTEQRPLWSLVTLDIEETL